MIKRFELDRWKSVLLLDFCPYWKILWVTWCATIKGFKNTIIRKIVKENCASFQSHSSIKIHDFPWKFYRSMEGCVLHFVIIKSIPFHRANAKGMLCSNREQGTIPGMTSGSLISGLNVHICISFPLASQAQINWSCHYEMIDRHLLV